MEKSLIIACDFDGSIVNHEYPKIGKLKPNAKEVINKLYDKGHKIIIWTCRYTEVDLSEMKNFLVKKKIKFHEINKNIQGLNFNPVPKIYANIYIDDRNIFMNGINWFDIEGYLFKNNII